MIDKLPDADQLAIKTNDITLFCHPMIVTRKLAKNVYYYVRN